MAPEFAHLHLHTDYSLLDGLGKIDAYVKTAKDRDVHHLAVTDHGVMYAAHEWWSTLTKAGLHPIVGMEAYLAEGSVADRERASYHLLLLAENDRGYRNLVKLASKAALDGYYYRPRIDLDMLSQHSAGLICTSACLGGPLAKNVLRGNVDRARSYATTLADVFGPERFYVELQDHGIPDQRTANCGLIELARDLDLPLIATNDVHYCDEDDAYAQEVLVCVQTQTTLDDPKRLKSDTNQLFLKSPAEMAQVFGDLPDALANTIAVAEMCTVDLSFKAYNLPTYPVPNNIATSADYLRTLCLDGCLRKYGHTSGEVRERLDFELGVIEKMGFVDYFLIVWDFVRYAKDNGIGVGPGRGSAAGSIVSYALDITTLDPLKYGLLFERFLNPDRVSMPDIDIDFADDRRHEVVDYVVRKYGDDHVAQIGTFGTMAAKGSIRDVGRAMGYGPNEIDRLAKMIPNGPGWTIDKAIAEGGPLRTEYERRPSTTRIIDTAKRVEGVVRHCSTHAAGVVISKDPLVDHVPLQRAGGKSSGTVTTQYGMDPLEKIGLLKLDFLGLTTLTHIRKTVESVAKRGVTVDVDSIPFDDEATYDMLCRGDTVGVFQIEGGATARMTTDIMPRDFEDIIALMALARPGPLDMAPDYVARKHGRAPVEYPHPNTRDILRDTYGIMLYQEQVMALANAIAGFTMAEADALRKAIGKKLPKEMAAIRDRFVDGCVEHGGMQEHEAVALWTKIEKHADYSFNRSHSASYATIAYQTAYLKCHHPAEFYAAMASTDIGNADKVASDVAACRRARLTVLPPDVNRSEWDFTVEEVDGTLAVRVGLGALRGLGERPAAAVVDARATKPTKTFDSFSDFCDAVDMAEVTKATLEVLAKSGAFDSFGERTLILALIERTMSAAKVQQKSHHLLPSTLRRSRRSRHGSARRWASP